jgi:hypothetical protein
MRPARSRRTTVTGHRGIRKTLAIGLALAVLAASGAAPPVRIPRFEKDVLPVLTAHCVKCHGEGKPKAGLDLRTRAGILQGGESGPALVPGSAGRSLLFSMVHKGEMPPRGAKLTPGQVALVKAWIDGGARGDPAAEGASKVTAQDRNFWAFRKPVRPALPAVRATERVRTPIDAFVLARLEGRGLTLSPEADRAVLLRRVTFDLTGLPPSLQ